MNQREQQLADATYEGWHRGFWCGFIFAGMVVGSTVMVICAFCWA